MCRVEVLTGKRRIYRGFEVYGLEFKIQEFLVFAFQASGRFESADFGGWDIEYCKASEAVQTGQWGTAQTLHIM